MPASKPRSKARTGTGAQPRATRLGERPTRGTRSASPGAPPERSRARAATEKKGRDAREYRPRERDWGRVPVAGEVRWGTHAVEEALRAGRARRLLIQDTLAHRPRLATLIEVAESSGVPVQRVSETDLEMRAGGDRHQGVLAVVAPFRYRSIDELLAAEQGEPPFFLMLDGVEDPQNLGAILRTADAAGVHGVFLPERRASPVTGTVARASAGAVDHVPLAQVTNVTRALDQMKRAGMWVYGLDLDGDRMYDEVDYTGPVVLVAGAEGKGMSRLVREQCDVIVSIPLGGAVESLNVSVATALALYAVRRSRDRGAAAASGEFGNDGV
jgi:23S rRNA (guanosine2251-2'-O)-methyltransferase